MSLRALPLILIVFVLYNVVVLFSGSNGPEHVLGAHILPPLRLVSGGLWVFTVGDALIALTMLLLFIELVKSTYTATTSLIDHGLSMLVFVACLIEFLIVPKASTSVFFFIMMASLIDVVAGFTIGIRVARRDLSIGADS